MLDKINSLKAEVEALTAGDAAEVEALRIKYLSKKGIIPALLVEFRSVPADQKRAIGVAINELKQQIKKRAEVFTPTWICNEQNNQVNEAWFGRANVFNTPNGTSWITTTDKIVFYDKKENMESAC